MAVGQIPVLSLVARSYVFVLTGLRPLMAVAWPWAGVVYVAGWAADVSGRTTMEGEPSHGLWISLMANLVANSAVSVLCHRSIILGEQPAGLRSLSFARREVHYLLALLGLGLAIVLAFVLSAGLMHIVGLDGESVGLVVIVVAALALYARLCLILPDLAVAEGRLPWHVWRASRGQTARIIVGVALSGLPLTLVVLQLALAARVLHVKGLVGTALLVELLALAVSFLIMMIGAAFLSFVYKILVLDPSLSGPGVLESGKDGS